MNKYLILIIILSYSCNDENTIGIKSLIDSEQNDKLENIHGHWYLVDYKSIDKSEYIEFIFDKDNSKINRDGQYWYDTKIFTYAKDSINIKLFNGRFEIFNTDSLVISKDNSDYIFKRVKNNCEDIKALDLEAYHIINFYAKTTNTKDSSRIDKMINHIFNQFGTKDFSDTLDYEEDLIQIPKYKMKGE